MIDVPKCFWKQMVQRGLSPENADDCCVFTELFDKQAELWLPRGIYAATYLESTTNAIEQMWPGYTDRRMGAV